MKNTHSAFIFGNGLSTQWVLYNKTRNDFFTCTGEYSTEDINFAQHYNYKPEHPDFEASLVSEINKKVYRYVEYLISQGGIDIHGEYVPSPYGPRVELRLQTYEVLKETPKGYWINISGFKQKDFPNERLEQKWVSKTAYSSFAKDSKEKARLGYIARKERQIRILKAQLIIAEKGKDMAKDL